MLIKKRTYVPHPEGMFDALLVSIDAHTIEVEGGKKDGYNLKFVTPEGEIIPWVSGTYSEKSNLGKAVKALLGTMPDDLDTDTLANRTCRLVIAHEQKGELTVDRVLQYLPHAPSQASLPGADDPFVNQ